MRTTEMSEAAVVMANEASYRRGYHQAVCQLIANFEAGMTLMEAVALEERVQSWRESRRFLVTPPPTWHRS